MTSDNPEEINGELPKQFDYIDKAEQLTIEWAKSNNINLYRIEFVVPFILTDQRLEVWLFFDTEHKMKEYELDGTSQIVKSKYLDFLVELNYPSDYLKEVSFITDSDENVQKNYEGSYFYRLR
jgi:hypothetical protein